MLAELPRRGQQLPRLAQVELGRRLAVVSVSRGLGSNVSTCDGPPGMKRKITRRARAGKCGARGARGSAARPRPRLVGQERRQGQRAEAGARPPQHLAAARQGSVAMSPSIMLLPIAPARPLGVDRDQSM